MRFRTLKKQSKHSNHLKKDTQKIKYAPTVNKIKAFITDMFMIYAPILYVIAYLIMGGKDAFQSSQIAPLAGVLLYGLIYATLIAKFGQTPGKKAYMMQVVDDTTYKNISFFRAFIRFIAFLFSATIIIGLFTGFFRKDKKSLHDILCSTVEIEVQE